MKPMGCLIFGVICIVAFCVLVLPLTIRLAVCLGAICDVQEPLLPAFVLTSIFLIVCIVKGIRAI